MFDAIPFIPVAYRLQLRDSPLSIQKRSNGWPYKGNQDLPRNFSICHPCSKRKKQTDIIFQTKDDHRSGGGCQKFAKLSPNAPGG